MIRWWILCKCEFWAVLFSLFSDCLLLVKYSCNPANYPSGFFTASAFSSLRVVLHFLRYWDFHIQILGLASEDGVCWYDLDSNSLKIGFQQWTAWFKGSTFGSDEILSSWVALLASVPSYCCYMLFIDGYSPMDSAKLIATIPPPQSRKSEWGKRQTSNSLLVMAGSISMMSRAYDGRLWHWFWVEAAVFLLPCHTSSFG